MKYEFKREIDSDDGEKFVELWLGGCEVTSCYEHELESEPVTEAFEACHTELKKWLAEGAPHPLTAEEAYVIWRDHRGSGVDALQAILDAVAARQKEIADLSLGGSRYA